MHVWLVQLVHMHNLRHVKESMQLLSLPSGETRMILTTCIAVIGSVGNSEHNLQVSGKAGRSRWLGSSSTSSWCCDEPS